MRSLIRATAPKTPADIAAEWDAAAATRHVQITSGKDLSFSNVLKPAILGLLDCCDRSRILDVGCGTGELTREVASRAQSVMGVDLSVTSIDLARTVCSDRNNVEFYVGAVEHLPSAFSSTPFSVGIAGMTLMTVPDLSGLVRKLSTLLAPGGRFLATLLHPCFWPRYWGYEEAPWFDYRHEIFIEAPFQISLDSSHLGALPQRPSRSRTISYATIARKDSPEAERRTYWVNAHDPRVALFIHVRSDDSASFATVFPSTSRVKGTLRHKFCVPGILFILFLGQQASHSHDAGALDGSSGHLVWVCPFEADSPFEGFGKLVRQAQRKGRHDYE